VTFHVSSVPDLMAAATAADFPIVSFDTEDDYWHEAFVDPRATQGILVQLGSLVGEEPTPLVPSDAPAAVCPTATFTRSTHAVRNLDRALDFFSGVLNGTVDCPDRGVADVTWARDHRLRLVEGANLERKGAAQLSFELGDLRAGGVRRAWSTELGVDVVVDIESGLLDAVVGEMKRSAVT
jgi:catechol 2,3-dioxygenase-like lactoylglutathione lyase family enzyme